MTSKTLTRNYLMAENMAFMQWEFLQRSIAGCREPMTAVELENLCGANIRAIDKISERAFARARLSHRNV